MSSSQAPVRGDGEPTRFPALKGIGRYRRTTVGLLLWILFLNRGLVDRDVVLVRLVGLESVLELLCEPLGVFVKLLGVGVAVVLQGGAHVHGDIPYRDTGGGSEELVQPVGHLFLEILLSLLFLDLFLLRESFYIAYVRASASVNQPRGPVEVTRTFRILVHDTADGLIVEAMDDCLYGSTNPSGRLTITCPLPNGELPADEDGDGIIVVDVMKKGFQGTMIIVLDPSRVFLGGPGFFGGNGMILEDLVARYDALGGINAGGFIDEDGAGSGGFPEGLTVLEGEAYLWADSGASAAFDNNNVLHVGYFKKEEVEKLGIRDCASFGPELIIDGRPEYGSYMESGINPRTAIGQREDGAVLMLCIDGRQLRSIGASFADIRDVMLDFGAVNACSLDGGSSTVMYYDGEYLNWPSSASGTSRYLPNAFLIRR